MTSIGTEQVRCESLLKPYTEAISLFRKQYRLYRSIPGVQRSITDGELMAACAFRTYEQFPQTSATEDACRMQVCANVHRWKTILKEYNLLEDAYSRKFPHAVSPSKSTGAGWGQGKSALTWDTLMADYETCAEDRKLLTLLWPHVREMGYAKDDRSVCVGYFAANVVLGLDQKRATTQCKAYLKLLDLSSDAQVANRLQTMLDGIEPTFKTIIGGEERQSKVAQTPSKGKGRVALSLGVKSTPGKTPLRKTRNVKESPLKRPREETEDKAKMEDSVPKRVRIDSSIGSETSVVEESDFAEAVPSSEAEVESIVRFHLFGIGRGNASTIADLPDEDAEGDGSTDAMEVDEPITPSKRRVFAQQERNRPRSKKPEELLEDVEEMDWPTLAAYRKRLIDARSKGRDTTELSRARWRPVFPDRKSWGEVAA